MCTQFQIRWEYVSRIRSLKVLGSVGFGFRFGGSVEGAENPQPTNSRVRRHGVYAIGAANWRFNYPSFAARRRVDWRPDAPVLTRGSRHTSASHFTVTTNHPWGTLRTNNRANNNISWNTSIFVSISPV